MADPVLADEIIKSGILLCLSDDFLELCLRAECEKDGACLCAAGIDMPDPVQLFFFQCIFMFQYHTAEIVVNGGASHDPILCPAIHCLGIDIVTGGFILQEGTVLDHPVQKIPGLFINLIRIDVCACRELGLRPVDPEERQGRRLHSAARLFGRIYVIGQGGDGGGEAFRGPDSPKGS